MTPQDKTAIIALTHEPSPHLVDGLRTHLPRVSIDFALAQDQHRDYCRMLSRLGAAVRTLDVNHDLPDSVFIEDCAVVVDEVAVIASMGTEARRAELSGIEAELRRYRMIKRISLPASLEGGDVLRMGRTLLVGLSSRTDAAGASALAKALEPFDYRVRAVPVRGCLHLKTACTGLDERTLLINPAWVDAAAVRGFNWIKVPDEEPFAANTLMLSGKVCMAAAYERTAELLTRAGYMVETVDISEFAKAEGAITCSSILFNEKP
jgi:dimethylargininase